MNIADAVRHLPVQERRVFTLCKVYQCTDHAIAVRMMLTDSQVRTILISATRHFADLLEEP